MEKVQCEVFPLMKAPLGGDIPLLGHGLVVKKFVDRSFCDDLIKDAEKCARFRGGWRTKRHENFPSTDLDLFIDFPAYVGLDVIVQVRPLVGIIKDFYKIPESLHFNVRDLFIARYASSAQEGLNIHNDGSHFSFVLNLSGMEEYQGGGTFFPDLSPDMSEAERGKNIRLDKGDIIMFPGGMVPHASKNVLAGKRYIVAGFVHFASVQRGISAHVEHKAQMLTNQVSKLGMQASDLANSFSALVGDGSMTKQPVIEHRQVYESYLDELSKLTFKWKELESI